MIRSAKPSPLTSPAPATEKPLIDRTASMPSRPEAVGAVEVGERGGRGHDRRRDHDRRAEVDHDVVEVEVDQVLEAEQQRPARGVEARDHPLGAARVEVVLQRVGIDIGGVEDRALHGAHGAVVRDVAQLDLGGVIGDVRRTAGRGVDELELAAAVEHEARVAGRRRPRR